jgi:hypothetical protein
VKIRFDSIYGLGDQLATIYSLENFGRQKGQTSEVCGGLSEDLVSLFNLNFVSFSRNKNYSIATVDVRSSPFISSYPKIGYAHYIVRLINTLAESGYQHTIAEPLNLKNSKKQNLSSVLGQFDSRFAKRHEFDLTKEQIRLIIKRIVKKEKILILGGSETQPYCDNEFFLGNIEQLTQIMVAAKKFVGVDSGMSHLAGVLGIESHVVLLLPYWYAKSNFNKNAKKELQNINNTTTDMQPSLIEYYKSYKKTTCYGRELFEFKI